MSLKKQIERRRTFAIISHPDAGKTTLTEKLLLYGGAIHTAGAVKARRSALASRSDWMELERKRGISVSSSVMQFDFEDIRYNLLDTPGHQDFSEDTYRTLMAADCAIMLIDAAKGVEDQTRRLFKVCRMRGIPVVTVVNKLDLPARDPFELMAEVEEVLELPTVPFTWPIGSGQLFQGVYNLRQKNVLKFMRTAGNAKPVPVKTAGIDDPKLSELLGEDAAEELKGSVELLEGAGEDYDNEAFLRGEISPVFFLSALSNFGVEPFLEAFAKLCPAPGRTKAADGSDVQAEDEAFSAFIFKVQANMDPAHRDRIAFARICSGKFSGGLRVHHARLKKEVRLAHAQQFMAQDRQIVEEAYAGDIVGLFDPGLFKIGDTLSSNPALLFDSVPRFSPEHFARIELDDPMKRKQFQKGTSQLSEEGTVQLFFQEGREKDPIVGVVGQLQFDVLVYRLEHEYGAKVRINSLPYRYARWVTGPKDIKDMQLARVAMPVLDQDKYFVALLRDDWELRSIQENNKSWQFHETAPLHLG
ncbi:MAG: peptide chain release factor 3 [Myxococcales bacterium]|nr:MAG: peptide chain release factor 3 [Myxococcales bacterium]